MTVGPIVAGASSPEAPPLKTELHQDQEGLRFGAIPQLALHALTWHGTYAYAQAKKAADEQRAACPLPAAAHTLPVLVRPEPNPYPEALAHLNSALSSCLPVKPLHTLILSFLFSYNTYDQIPALQRALLRDLKAREIPMPPLTPFATTSILLIDPCENPNPNRALTVRSADPQRVCWIYGQRTIPDTRDPGITKFDGSTSFLTLPWGADDRTNAFARATFHDLLVCQIDMQRKVFEGALLLRVVDLKLQAAPKVSAQEVSEARAEACATVLKGLIPCQRPFLDRIFDGFIRPQAAFTAGFKAAFEQSQKQIEIRRARHNIFFGRDPRAGAPAAAAGAGKGAPPKKPAA